MRWNLRGLQQQGSLQKQTKDLKWFRSGWSMLVCCPLRPTAFTNECSNMTWTSLCCHIWTMPAGRSWALDRGSCVQSSSPISHRTTPIICPRKILRGMTGLLAGFRQDLVLWGGHNRMWRRRQRHLQEHRRRPRPRAPFLASLRRREQRSPHCFAESRQQIFAFDACTRSLLCLFTPSTSILS